MLDSIAQGDPKAAEELLPHVYNELRKLAAHKMASQPPGQSVARPVRVEPRPFAGGAFKPGLPRLAGCNMLEASSNLADREMIGLAEDQGLGACAFEDANAARFPARFYRMVSGHEAGNRVCVVGMGKVLRTETTYEKQENQQDRGFNGSSSAGGGDCAPGIGSGARPSTPLIPAPRWRAWLATMTVGFGKG